MNVLVTGGAGYIGSHTCKILHQAGHLPITYDNLIYGHRDAVRWGPFVLGDILDTCKMDHVFKTYEIEAVIHFAAFAYVGESVQDPGKYYQNNVAGTITLLESMRRNNCKMIIFSSTCATFGIPSSLPIHEKAPQCPINPYGKSKLMIEQILTDYHMAYGFRHIILRYFNAAGADPEGELGERHEPETHLVPLVIDAALGRRQYIEIYGKDYPTPDGTAIRDYVHVCDLAAAHAQALYYLESGETSTTFNLGTGKGISVQEIISAVERISGRKIPTISGARRPGDPPSLISLPAKAETKLKWRPLLSDIDSIAQTAWDFHQKNLTQNH